MIAAPLAMLIAIRPLLFEPTPATGAIVDTADVRPIGGVVAGWLGGAGGGVRGRRDLLEPAGAAGRAGRAARARRRAAGVHADRARRTGALRRAGSLRRLRADAAPTRTCRWSSSPTPTSPPARKSRSTPATPTARSTSTPSRTGTLDRFPYVITGRAAWNSEAPPSFKRVAATPSYILWKRTGPTPENRHVLLEGTEAGGARRLRLAGDPHPHRQPRPRLALSRRRDRRQGSLEPRARPWRPASAPRRPCACRAGAGASRCSTSPPST